MSDSKDQDQGKGRLSLRPGRLELGRTVNAGSVRQSFSHGRSKVVEVEVRKKRGPVPGAPGAPAPSGGARSPAAGRPAGAGRALTASELATRQRVLEAERIEAAKREVERREQEKISILSAAEEARRREEEERRAAEAEVREAADAERRAREEQQVTAADAVVQAAAPGLRIVEQPKKPVVRTAPGAAPAAGAPAAATPANAETLRLRARTEEDDGVRRPGAVARKPGGAALPARRPPAVVPKKGLDARRGGRIDVQAAIEGDDDKTRSLASVRRQREARAPPAGAGAAPRRRRAPCARRDPARDHLGVRARQPHGDPDPRRGEVADAHGRDGDAGADHRRRHRRAGDPGVRPSRAPRLGKRRGARHRGRGRRWRSIFSRVRPW